MLELPEEEVQDWPSKALASSENPLQQILYGDGNQDGEPTAETDSSPDPGKFPEVPGFEILEKLGEGGMGVVYRATQAAVGDETGLREVALKILKSNFSDPKTCDRLMRMEMRIHANLTTPHVASFFDAGLTPSGQCYFTMELVDGSSITKFAKSHGFTTRQKINLFLQLCDGVANAHRFGAIHGDLTPSNILVTKKAEEPLVKIIDFGIADFLESQAEDDGGRTRKKRFGKWLYMAPESFDPNHGLNFQSDVYALGVLLFELLIGFPLFEQGFFKTQSNSRQMELIRRGLESKPSDILKSRYPAARREARAVRGDLDSIILKALACDPNQRYETVKDLATDLRCHLGHKVVSARRTPVILQGWKVFRRHTLGVSMGLLLLGSILYSAISSHRQKLETQLALNRLQVTFKFFEELITSPHPLYEGSDVRVVDVLAKGEDALRQYGTVDPEMERRIRTTIGEIYFGLGLYVQAMNQYDTALEIIHRSDKPQKMAVAHLFDRRARALRNLGHLDRAKEEFENALELEKGAVGASDPSFCETQLGLASVHLNRGEYDLAAELSEQAWLQLENTLDPEDPRVLDARVFLANAWVYSGQIKQAIVALQEVWTSQERALGPSHPTVLTTRQNLANALFEDRQFHSARDHFLKIVAFREEILGGDHPLTLNSKHGLALALMGLGELDQAEKILEVVLAKQRDILGPTHLRTLITQNTYARAVGLQNKVNKAIDLLRDLIEKYRELGRENSRQSLYCKNNLGHFLTVAGRCDEAEVLLLEVWERKQGEWGPYDPSTLVSLVSLGELYEEMGDGFHALACYEKVLAPEASHHPRRPYFQALYARCLAGLGHLDSAQVLLLDSLKETEPETSDYTAIESILTQLFQQTQSLEAP